MTRTVPNAFGSLTNPQLPNLDQDFVALASGIVVACTATGTNAVTLAPVVGTVTVSSYSDKDRYGFVAAATSTGPMTMQVNALGFVNVYKPGGVTQANAGDATISEYYDVVFVQTLNSNAGGFMLVGSPQVQEGSWTPVLAGSAVAGVHTYATQVGRYILQGNSITIWADIVLSALGGTISGLTTITGAPFNTSNIGSLNPALTVAQWGMITLQSGYSQIGIQIQQGSAQIVLEQSGSGLSSAGLPTNGSLSSTTSLNFGGTYRIN